MYSKDQIKKLLESVSDDILSWEYSDWFLDLMCKNLENENRGGIVSAYSLCLTKISDKVLYNCRSFLNSISKEELEDIIVQKRQNLSKKFNSRKANEVTFLTASVKNGCKSLIKEKKISLNFTDSSLPIVTDNSSISLNPKNYLSRFISEDNLRTKNISNLVKIANPKGFFDFLKDSENASLKHISINSSFFIEGIPNKLKTCKKENYYGVHSNNYSKYKNILQLRERKLMELAVSLVKECKANFENEIIPNKTFKPGKKSEYRGIVPLLSAVAVNRDGEIIKTSYKGINGNMDHHCEFTLFEDILNENDKNDLKGGELYVTLEPCHHRGTYIDENGNKKPKLPCAVRCAMANVDTIYIGSFDPDETVNWKGAMTLKTGLYELPIDKEGMPYISGKIKPKKVEKEKERIKHLKAFFESKKFKVLKKKTNSWIYKIAEPTNVKLFHNDLALELSELNRDFLENRLIDSAFYTN